MSKKISRWLNSRRGRTGLIGILGVLVIVAVVGQLAGWWDALGGLITGTVVEPPPLASFAPPEGGYTCMPSCDVTDGKFLSMPGEDMASFGGESLILWISVPGNYESFELSIFDGDSGRDVYGNLGNAAEGNWDNTTTQSTYALFSDPMKAGFSPGEVELGRWYGNDPNATGGPYCTTPAETMPNNDWYTITCANASQARGNSGHFFYRLEVTRPVEGHGINALKLRSNAYLSTGHAELVDSQFAVVGMVGTLGDIDILYPELKSWSDMGPSTYTGDWDFRFYVPEEATFLDIWDGDFDRGTSASRDADTDDNNTEGRPAWASPYAVDEGAGGAGNPMDDYPNFIYRRSPAVWYEFIDPEGFPVYINEEPSGTEEWEHYAISTDPATNPDLVVDDIKPGFYTLHINGLDIHNTVWLRVQYEVADQPPPPTCDATCPRTIGYWKNNVSKTLAGKTNGVQETRESIEAALRLIALSSELYRHGINLADPEPIADPTPLTLEEAEMILQRKKNNYQGADSQSMLARALQQNLATWLNWGTGKICDTTQVELNVAGGPYRNRLRAALGETERIMLNGDMANMERAKDIGDQINNGLLGEDAETSVCTDYAQVIPPDKQPPKYDDMPVAPTPEPPPNPTPVPPPDPATCAGVRTNTYGIEVTNNPFYGIKYEYKSGTEIKNGDYDIFEFVVPADVAAAMTQVQMEAKAGQDVGEFVTLQGKFDQPLPSGEPLMGQNRFFAFSFLGGQDNGDGTFTLTFQIQNMSDHGLSHVTVGLPDGVVPSAPSGNYQSSVCPPQ